jgi:hypothetical protein
LRPDLHVLADAQRAIADDAVDRRHDIRIGEVQLALPLHRLIVSQRGLSLREGSRIPSLGVVFSRVMRTRSGRVGMMAGWAWVGLHFFAR